MGNHGKIKWENKAKVFIIIPKKDLADSLCKIYFIFFIKKCVTLVPTLKSVNLWNHSFFVEYLLALKHFKEM